MVERARKCLYIRKRIVASVHPYWFLWGGFWDGWLFFHPRSLVAAARGLDNIWNLCRQFFRFAGVKWINWNIAKGSVRSMQIPLAISSNANIVYLFLKDVIMGCLQKWGWDADYKISYVQSTLCSYASLWSISIHYSPQHLEDLNPLPPCSYIAHFVEILACWRATVLVDAIWVCHGQRFILRR